MKKITLLALLFLPPVALRAADRMPATPAGDAKLAALVGSWRGEAALREPGKPATKVRVTIDCSSSSGGWAVRCDTKMVSPDMNYLETDLFGTDPSSGTVHWYAVTNAGEVHDHVGSWSDPHHLSVRYAGGMGREATTEEITLSLDQGSMTLNSVTRAGDPAASTIASTLTGTVVRAH